MTLLTGHALSRARRIADRALPDPGAIWRSTYSSDSKGGQTTSRTRVWTGHVRVAPLSTVVESEAVVAARLAGSRGVWITLPYRTDVRLDDQVIVGGRTYEVAGFDTGRSWHISKRVLAREIT